MLKFSIILPTRNRVEPLKKLIESIHETTNRPDQIEVLIICDGDDLESLQALNQLVDEYKVLNISRYVRARSDFINEDYYNYLARKTKGKFIWVSADDLIFQVKNWDLIIWEKLTEYLLDKPDRLVCANILDNTPGPGNPPANKNEFPCFPLFSREVIQQLGFILAPQLPTWGADRYAYRLFSQV